MQISISTNAPLVRQGLENLNAELPKIGRRRIYNMMLKIRSDLRRPGAPVTYPVRWDSEKQRRAFFATDGFGRGIPTVRTGAYNAGYMIVRTDRGYRLENRLAYAKYVGGSAYGTQQSRIHGGRWKLMRDIVDEHIETLPEEVAREIDLVSRREMPK